MRSTHRDHHRSSPERRGAGVTCVVLLSLLLLSSSGLPARAAEESPHESTDDVGPTGKPAVGSFKEPQVDADRELEAIVAAFLGEPFDDPPDSSVLIETIAELRAEPAPEGEVFALVTVTDRTTGERRMFTRGVPKPEIARYLDDPASAPPGTSYSEGDTVRATEKVEIAVRSVSVHAHTPPPDELSREHEAELDLKERNTGTGLSHRIEQGLSQRIASGEIDLTTSKAVPVAITLKGVPRVSLPKAGDVVVDGLLWIGLDLQAEREKAVIDRQELVAGLQAEAVADIDGLGGVVRYASWTSGTIEADVPASAIPILAERDDVFSLEYLEPHVELGMQGDDYYQPTNYAAYDPVHVGLHGPAGKHLYSSRIVLGLSDQCIDPGNPAWDNNLGGFNRGWFYDCDVSSGFCAPGGIHACSGAHGTQVAGLIVGDFMDGQDPAMTATNRRKLTGTCPECRFFFLQDEGIDDRSRVADTACGLGVDVFVSSRASFGESCNGNGSDDAAIQALVDCNTAWVQAAGHRGSTGDCSTSYPADHPWTFAVGGMDTDAPCDTASSYFSADCVYDDEAPRGGGRYNANGKASIIDQTGPFRLSNLIAPGTGNPVELDSDYGTSFAAPVVGGLMADVMDWYRQHSSSSIFFSNRIRNFMLLFGDRSVRANGRRMALNYHDDRWGSGRTVLFPFDDEAGWSMRRSSRTLSANEDWIITVPVDSSASYFKAVVWHDGNNYQNEPKITMTLDPRGCSSPTRTVNRLDSKALRVVNLAGCDDVRVTVTNTRQGTSGSRLFHFAALAVGSWERGW